MGIFKPVREGSWWTESKADPRFNINGRGDVGGFVIPRECWEKLTVLSQKLGVPIPEDLEYAYMKD